MYKEQILDTYESFKDTEDGCDELHYYRDNVLMAMEEYHKAKLKLLGIADVVSSKFLCGREEQHPLKRCEEQCGWCEGDE
jgi:hypothetical protein